MCHIGTYKFVGLPSFVCLGICVCLYGERNCIVASNTTQRSRFGHTLRTRDCETIALGWAIVCVCVCVSFVGGWVCKCVRPEHRVSV